MPRKPANKTAVERELTIVAAELAEALERVRILYEHRDNLLVIGRGLDPQMTRPELGRLAGCTAEAVDQVLIKRRIRANGK